jgi:hypothetical protein
MILYDIVGNLLFRPFLYVSTEVAVVFFGQKVRKNPTLFQEMFISIIAIILFLICIGLLVVFIGYAN